MQRTGTGVRMGGHDEADITGLLARMDERLAALGKQDNRRMFLMTYRQMTRTMLDGAEGEEFLDPGWVRRLTANFAALYFEADDAYEGTRPCPRAWERAFEVAGMRRVHPLEHVLLGINAHITYDLPRAVATTMRDFRDHLESGAGGSPSAGVTARRRYDYERVNFLLARTIDPVQDMIAEHFAPFIRVVDVLAGRFDEYLAEIALRFARSQGWHVAVALAYAETEEEERRICTHLEDVALEFVQRIDLVEMLPTPAVRWFARRFRRPFVDSDLVSTRVHRRWSRPSVFG